MEWTRKGECNHCGFCCMFLSNSLTPVNSTAEALTPPGKECVDEAHLVVRQFEEVGPGRYQGGAWLYSPCSEYDMDTLRCGINDKKPMTCREFPTTPDQVLGTPCSYYFERTADDKVFRQGGEGSQFPGRSVEKGDRIFTSIEPYPCVPYPLIMPRYVLKEGDPPCYLS